MSLKKTSRPSLIKFLTVAVRIRGPRVARLTLSTERTGAPWEFGGNGLRTRTSARPGRIVLSKPVDLPRPRDLDISGSRQMTGFP